MHANRLCPGCRSLDGEHDFGPTCTVSRDVTHDVDWFGIFRGTEEDPREMGWCPTCNREVYDRDSVNHCVWDKP